MELTQHHNRAALSMIYSRLRNRQAGMHRLLDDGPGERSDRTGVVGPVLTHADRLERVRQVLRTEQFASTWDRPLSFWVLTADRWLPRPLLAQPLRSVLSASVEELHALPAVGTRKLQTLTVLLQRIASGPSVAPGGTLSAGLGDPGASFDAAALTEANWEAWRQLVRRHLPVDEPLGRFTDSLRQLPRSIWWTPLDWYCRLSLAEMRRLRSHGRKRVAAILRVFNGLRIRLQAESGVTTVWRSPRISAVEQWMAEIDEHSPAVGLETFEQRFVVPVVEQLAVDLGSRFARLVHAELRSRSGVVPITGQVTGPVGQESRARIFQVMQNAGTALALRWPDAAGRISTLRSYGGLTRSSPACRILDYLRAKILVASVDHRRAVRPCGTERTQRL